MVEFFRGKASPSEEGPKDPSRRRFMKQAASVGVVGAAGLTAGGQATAGEDPLLPKEKPQETDRLLSDNESLESHKITTEGIERFEEYINGFVIHYQKLGINQVLFVDEHNQPIEIVTLESIPGQNARPAFETDSKDVTVPYTKPSPGIPAGEFDNDGILVGEMNQDWLDEQRRRICELHPEVICDLEHDLPTQLNSIAALREARNTADEPELQQSSPETFMDIVNHYGNKKTIGAEEQTRIKFVRDIPFSENTPFSASLMEHLRYLLPGLAAQESRFNNDSKSAKGARGIFQFMPEVWEELGYKPEELNSLQKQREAVGTLFERNYSFIIERAEEELNLIRKQYFDLGALPKDSEDRLEEGGFNQYFLAPLLVNAYHSGRSRMLAVLKYVTSGEGKEKLDAPVSELDGDLHGYDLYHAITKVAVAEDKTDSLKLFSRHSGEYVARTVTLARIINTQSI